MPGGFPLWLSTDPKSHISCNSLLSYRALTNTGYEEKPAPPTFLGFQKGKAISSKRGARHWKGRAWKAIISFPNFACTGYGGANLSKVDTQPNSEMLSSQKCIRVPIP